MLQNQRQDNATASHARRGKSYSFVLLFIQILAKFLSATLASFSHMYVDSVLRTIMSARVLS